MNKIVPIVILSLLTACEKTEWMDHPPKAFQGTFYEVSDEIVHGDEQPLIFQITDTELNWRKGQQMLDSVTPMAMSLSIVAVCKTDNSIVIFCGEKDADHLAEFRYELAFGEGNFLYIDAIVTDPNNEDVKFNEGMFTANNYLKH